MQTQTTPEDAVNAALPGVTPAAVLRAMDDPSVIIESARGDYYVNMGLMRRLMANPNTPIGVRLEYMKHLSKVGRVEEPEVQQNAARLPTINIVFPNAGRTTTIAAAPSHPVIDVTPEE